MEVRIDNTLSGDSRTVDLSADEAIIGRPDPTLPDPEIAIRSPLVSRQQARLRQENGAWTVEHLGSNDTHLGSLVLELAKTYRVKPGDEIRIAEFVISLVDESVRRVTSEDLLRQAELMAFENDIHEALLDRMDLRRAEAQADLHSPETRKRIETALDELVDNALSGARPELLEHILHTYVHRRMTWRITAAGTERGARRRSSVAKTLVAFEENLSGVLDRLGRQCGLSFDPKRMAEDIELLEAGFEEAFEAHRLEFSEGLARYVVNGAIKQEILDIIFGLGPLQDLMEMDSIGEIMVIARDQIFIEKFGVIEDSRRSFFSDELLMSTIERIVAPIGRRIDKSSPLVDAHLPDGSRVNAVIPPLAIKGPCVTIRKFSATPLTIDDLVRYEAVSAQMVKFIRACVECELNVVVSGGTGSGKTTFLNCLSDFISPRHRIITIEDTAELQLKQRHVVTLESRPANMEGKGAITIRDLVKNALRMRPDRIVVGECRGAETLDMLQAMNTGHDGSMTTAHANSPLDMMLRLETMVLQGTSMPVSAIREQIIAAVDLVVQLIRFPDGKRCVTHVSEVVGIDDETGSIIVEDIFRYLPPGRGEYAGGRFVHTGYIPTFIEKLLLKGAVDLEDFF